MIYLVSKSPYNEDFILKYATSENEIIDIVIDYLKEIGLYDDINCVYFSDNNTIIAAENLSKYSDKFTFYYVTVPKI